MNYRIAIAILAGSLAAGARLRPIHSAVRGQEQGRDQLHDDGYCELGQR